MQARTECNRVVNFHFQNPNILGKLVDIKIDEALSNSLKGTLFTQ
jgi:tRNA-2-methylthio-N6-dimethylallyladenosine synthase